MHIDVCICTFRRAALLKRLLGRLKEQITHGRFAYSIVVVENDILESSRAIVGEMAEAGDIRIAYFVEPIQNIARARNKAVDNAKGDFIAFIDDDEIPPSNWLYLMFEALIRFDVSGVLGPVIPLFETEPPNWIRKGRFFERPRHPTGYIMHWTECRTGNVLFKRDIIVGMKIVFNPIFGANAEDQDFFRRLQINGHRFAWCNEAFVEETVPPHRWKLKFMIHRAMLRGRTSTLHPYPRLLFTIKSIFAIAVYGLALPILLLLGSRYFLTYLIKLVDHTGKILALLGLNPVKERKM